MGWSRRVVGVGAVVVGMVMVRVVVVGVEHAGAWWCLEWSEMVVVGV